MAGLMILQRNARKVFLLLAVCSVMLFCVMIVARPQKAAAAACAPSGDRGAVTYTLTNVTAGTYKVWSRMMSAGGGNDSYFLEIDGNTCYVVGDNTGISSSSWTWVDYQNGNTGTKINHNFSAGNHTIKLIGREDNVKLDRVLFLTGSCTPTGNGDNCTIVNESPTVSFVSPTPANNATVSTSPVNIAVSASDSDGSIQRVEFQIDNGQVQTDNSSPYEYSWPVSAANNGSHTIKATAFDNQGVPSTTITRNITVNVSTPDTTPPTVSITSPTAGTDIKTNSVTITASASDSSGIKQVDFYYGNTFIGRSSSSSSPYSITWNTSGLPNGSYNLRAKATDNSSSSNENYSATVNVSINHPDAEKPTAPGNLRSTSVNPDSVSLAWDASSDNVGVDYYVVYRGSAVIANKVKGTTYTDSGRIPQSSYSYRVRAVDATGNQSSYSNTLNVTTPARPDTTPPSAPDKVTATAVSAAQINITWTASKDDVGVSKYRIYRKGGALVAEVGGGVTSYGHYRLTPGATYTYYVVAVDAAGNVSGNSSTASVTTHSLNTKEPTTSNNNREGNNESGDAELASNLEPSVLPGLFIKAPAPEKVEFTRVSIGGIVEKPLKIRVQYSTTIDGKILEFETPEVDVNGEFSLPLDSDALIPGTTYAYQIIANDGTEEIKSGLQTFKTLGYTVHILVKDKDGKIVKNKNVTLRSDPQTVKSDSEGAAVFKNVAPGDHNVEVESGSKVLSGSITVADTVAEVDGLQVADVQNFAVTLDGTLPGGISPYIVYGSGLAAVVVLLLGGYIIIRRRRGNGFAQSSANGVIGYQYPSSAGTQQSITSGQPNAGIPGQPVPPVDTATLEERLSRLQGSSKTTSHPGQVITPQSQDSDKGNT